MNLLESGMIAYHDYQIVDVGHVIDFFCQLVGRHEQWDDQNHDDRGPCALVLWRAECQLFRHTFVFHPNPKEVLLKRMTFLINQNEEKCENLTYSDSIFGVSKIFKIDKSITRFQIDGFYLSIT